VLRCNSPSGKVRISGSEEMSLQILGDSIPKEALERQSDTIPLPERWIRWPLVPVAVFCNQPSDQSVEASFVVGIAAVDYDVRFLSVFRQERGRVVVAFDDSDGGVGGAEGVGDATEEHGEGAGCQGGGDGVED
jgi:hypothetical protein